ncbi:hypothetical protein BpHYR1_038846 [Brachionus plicatilis]|uniref:Uncharacterized protein n=1 Tax=Brachionus plicatilis TaxID=10195 RepID=A0A3M7QGW2_BRAPC|nr:hypothetical protein BpHYR1_038846 [Brachionus plicatilis]
MTSVEDPHGSRRLTKILSITSDHFKEIRNLVSLENRKASPGISTENEGSRINVISVNTNHEKTDELPDDWTSYNFERKRSCILSNIYSTCVTKAINHLESLQLSIDKWLSAYENQSISSQESESSK